MKNNSQPYKILKYLALGTGILAISLVSPLGGARIIHSALKYIFNGYIRKKRFEKWRFLQDLKRLQKRELIEYQEWPNGKIEIKLLKQGRALTMRYDFDKMRLDKSKRWDGKWRLVMFDIPHSKKAARDALRQKLKELEFYALQKSVFLSPYPCENEIDFIGTVFDIRHNIILLPLGRFEGEEKLKYHFDLN